MSLRPGDPVRLRADIADSLTLGVFGDGVGVLRMVVPRGERSIITWAVVDMPGLGPSLPTDFDYLEFAADCAHPGCLESVEVARDCWLSRRPVVL